MDIKLRQLTPKDIYDAIEQGSRIISSDNDFTKLSNDPVCLMIANEIDKLSKEEIESIIGGRWKTDLLTPIYASKNYFLFGFVLEKGAFVEEIFEGSKWLLENIPRKTPALYEALFLTETYKRDSYINKAQAFFARLSTGLHQHSQEEKNEITYRVVKAFGKKYKAEITEEIVHLAQSYSRSESPFMATIATALEDLGIMLSQEDLLNKILPQTQPSGKERRFYMEDYQRRKFVNLLSLGYTIDEDKYSYNGDTLLVAILKSGEENIVKEFLPYIKKFTPIKITVEQQTELIENYKSSRHYGEIKNQYDWLLMNHQVPLNERQKAEGLKSRHKI